MKKITFTLLMALLALTAFAQESSSKTFLLRPYFENGIDFIKNDNLKMSYKSESKYFWGLGFQFGDPNKSKVTPYAQFTLSSFSVENNIPLIGLETDNLRTSQLSAGVYIPLKKFDDICLRSKLGYSFAKIDESINDINSNSHGFQIGLGVDRKLIGNSRVFIDLIYNYQKTEKSVFRDFDMTKLSVGIIL